MTKKTAYQKTEKDYLGQILSEFVLDGGLAEENSSNFLKRELNFTRKNYEGGISGIFSQTGKLRAVKYAGKSYPVESGDFRMGDVLSDSPIEHEEKVINNILTSGREYTKSIFSPLSAVAPSGGKNRFYNFGKAPKYEKQEYLPEIILEMFEDNVDLKQIPQFINSKYGEKYEIYKWEDILGFYLKGILKYIIFQGKKIEKVHEDVLILQEQKARRKLERIREKKIKEENKKT